LAGESVVTKPTISDLLDGVATSLRESVLPEIPPGPTRRQIQAAISIIRRAALVSDKIGPYLYADNKDIEETLRQACSTLDRVESNASGADLKPLRQRLHAALDRRGDPEVEYPSPAALGARNVELQALLVELQQALHGPSLSESDGHLEGAERNETVAMLRGLFRRMLERELQVTAPPSARK
jgi:hypothetical protein